MKFSERIGKRLPKESIQIDSMDNDLRNGLWNVFLEYIINPLKEHYEYNYSIDFTPKYKTLIIKIWSEFLKMPADEIPYTIGHAGVSIKEIFTKSEYLEVYDFVDFIANYTGSAFHVGKVVNAFNNILKKELSAYQFVNGQLSPVISEVEINSIEQAIQMNYENVYKGASIHLTNALEKLSDRREPDYRNSIKEAISAVESVCQVITGDPKSTLGPALKKIEQKLPLHGSLKEGLLKIYGYTSDSDGIRHALQDEPNLSQEDALFMLVMCSTFVNYLTIKASRPAATPPLPRPSGSSK